MNSFSDTDDPFELTCSPVTSEESEKIRAMILKGQLDVNATCDECSILGNLAFAGDIETVRMMLEHGADPNLDLHNPRVEPPLMDAVNGGNLEMVELLVEAGANVDTMSGGSFAL